MKDIRDFHEILDEIKIMMVQKNQDYGPYNIAHAPGGAMNGLLVRMHDKMERLKNLSYNKGNTPNYESIEDTLKDLANYAIIGLLVQRGQWEGTSGAKVHK
jgi:predicted DNA-binding protein